MQVDLKRCASGVPGCDLAFSSDNDKVSLEYAGQNSQNATRMMKGGNSASYRNPCKSPNGRVPAGHGLLGVVFSVVAERRLNLAQPLEAGITGPPKTLRRVSDG